MNAATAPQPLPRVRPCQRCRRRHKSWRTVALCRWPRSEWVVGNPSFAGPCFASVSHCPRGITVILYPTKAEAEAAKRLIDRLACGGRCMKLHRVERMRRDGGEDDA
jgi:hypothetical protein